MELELLDHSFGILDNCDHNVSILADTIEHLHNQMNKVLGFDGAYTVDKPICPNTKHLNREAWLYVIDVFRWCQRWVDDSVSFGDANGLIDDMGNSVATVSIWIPDTLEFTDDFKDRINQNWELIGNVFDQLNQNFVTMYK